YESLVHMFYAAVEAEPDGIAVIYEDRQLTYAEFGRAVTGFAERLRSERGGRILVMMPNSIEMNVAITAVMSVGAQVAPVNPLLKARELEKALTDVGARILICDADTREKAEQVAPAIGVEEIIVLGEGGVEIDQWTSQSPSVAAPAPAEDTLPRADDFALLIFTGGSTGIPKGVNHTHRGLMAGILQHVSVWPLNFGAERFLNVAPMFHIWGLGYATWVPIYSRGTLVMIPRYDPDKMVRALGAHKITVFGGGPAPIYMGLLTSPLFDETDMSSLKYCLSGGAPCPEDLHREWKARTGCPLLEGWGMTEG